MTCHILNLSCCEIALISKQPFANFIKIQIDNDECKLCGSVEADDEVDTM